MALVVGLLLGLTDVLPKTPMEPEVILLAFLPVLVFEGALLAAGLVSRKKHAELRAAFQRRVIDAEEILRSTAADEARDPVVDRALLHAQKSALIDAARRGLVGADAVEAQVATLDRELIALTHEEGEH